VQVELCHERLGDICKLGGPVGKPCRRARQAHARIVERDAPEFPAQRRDDVTVEERPARVPVIKKQHRPVAFVDVMHDVAAQFHEAALEREKLVADPVGPAAGCRIGHASRLRLNG